MATASQRPVASISPVSRLRQGLLALRPSLSDRHRFLISSVLTDEQAALVYELPMFDQAHLCRVYECLVELGENDDDLLIAALMHDIGKVHRGRSVTLSHRVVRVLLGKVAPNVLDWLARSPTPRWRHGFVLAVHHASFGAEKAAAVDCSPRVCWLIARHEDDPPPNDAGLLLLIAADNAA